MTGRRGAGGIWLLVAVALLLAPHLGPTSAAAPRPHRSGPARPARATPAASTGVAARAVAFALAQRGKPYRWGATGPGAFDCSGLTQAAWAHAGVSIPRTAAGQLAALRHALDLLGWSQLSPDEQFLALCGAASGLGLALLLVALYWPRGGAS